MTLDPTRIHFLTLTREQQAQAIRRLAYQGHSEWTIASATGLSVEIVKRVIGEHQASPAESSR